jgi:anthranilate phosphoribosyltransferase
MADLWSALFENLGAKKDLTPELSTFVMTEILEGRAEEENVKKFLLSLKEKGESAQDITQLVEMLYKYALPISISDRAVDPVGTGGDGKNTVNISTSAAIVTTAAGARVVKHGSIAASSKSGSADVLSALGIATDLTGPEVEESVYKFGIGFMKATTFHSALRHAAPARRALGIPTVFNILGPLANPAKPQVIALGVAPKEKLPIMAQVIADRGGEGFAFRGDDGIDELTLATTSTVLQIYNGQIQTFSFDPMDIGIERAPLSSLVGGVPEVNAKIIREIFEGKRGPIRDAIALNAAITIAAFKADFGIGLTQQIANGYVLAQQAIDSGAAGDLLENWSAFTREISPSSANS